MNKIQELKYELSVLELELKTVDSKLQHTPIKRRTIPLPQQFQPIKIISNTYV